MNDRTLTHNDLQDFNNDVISEFKAEGLSENDVKELLQIFEQAIERAELVWMRYGGFDLQEFASARMSGKTDFDLHVERIEFEHDTENRRVYLWDGLFIKGEQRLEINSIAREKPAR